MQERQLKLMGIMVDQTRVFEDYAAAMGRTVDSLTEAEKQSLFFNAALTDLHAKAMLAPEPVETLSKAITRSRVEFNDAAESYAVATNRLENWLWLARAAAALGGPGGLARAGGMNVPTVRICGLRDHAPAGGGRLAGSERDPGSARGGIQGAGGRLPQAPTGAARDRPVEVQDGRSDGGRGSGGAACEAMDAAVLDSIEAAEKEKAAKLEVARKFEAELIALQIQASAEGSIQRESLELWALADLYSQKLEMAKGNAEAIVALDQWVAAQITAIDKRNTDVRVKTADDERRRVMQYRFAIANQAIELGAAMFGNTKAVAFASTVVHTAEGVMSALAMYPPNVPLAALIAATGAVELATIASTNIGGGAGSVPGPGGATAAPTGAATSPGARETQVTIYLDGHGIIQDMDAFARELNKAISTQNAEQGI